MVEAQWLPWLTKQALLRDVTATYAGAKARTVKKVITAQTWSGTTGKALQLPPEHQPQGTFSIDLVPVKDAEAVLASAPAGLVVVVVRADRPKSVTRVTHMGLLMQGPHGPMLRHASRSFHRVVDEPLSRYLTRNLEFGTWTVEGLSLFEAIAPGASAAPPTQP